MSATLYYDGHCPLCAKEISLLRKIHRGTLAFVDVHTLSDYTEETRQKMLKMLHLRDQDGRWYIGADATVEAWSHTPYGLLFKPLRWPLIGSVVDLVYQVWAKRRYHKLYECGVCKVYQR
ncbi:MAG TPA: DUF393 domain-containing protein [Pseudomonadales bacterium]|nr:DUF393 domain-containing protein [Pseudomonadales bacterium]